MTAVWRVVRAEALRRWASWLALAALVALVGGTVLTGVSAARRTESAFPDYLRRYGYDGYTFVSAPGVSATIHHWSYVRAFVPAPVYVNAGSVADGQYVPGNPTLVVPLSRAITSKVAKLASGRLAVGVSEIDVGFTMAQQYHLHVGSTVTVPFYARSQSKVVFASTGTPPAHGARMRFTVVGVVASILDFPSPNPTYGIYVSPAFASTIGRRSVSGTVAFVRLARGSADLPRFAYEVNHLQVPGGFVGVQPIDDQTAAIEGSIHPQAVGWWLFALLAALAGIALVGQALSRQGVVARDLHPTVSALGMRPTQLFAVGMARAAAIGVAGAAGSLAMAAALSPLTPVGEARVAEPATGFVVDPATFGLGAVAVIVAVLVLGAWPAARDAQVARLRRREARLTGSGVSRVAAAAASAGAPPTAVVGVRHALERGRGRSSVPVATAIVGTVAAVGALVATSVFGSSLSTLLSTPRLYGQDFQVVLNNLTYGQIQRIDARLVHDPAVERVTAAQPGKLITVNGVPVNAALVVSEKGQLVLSMASGHEPTGHELALGTQTLRAANAAVGSPVRVVLIGPSGHTTTGQFPVSGTAVFPPSISSGGGLGVGAVVPLGSALAFACGTGPTSRACHATVASKIFSPSNTSWALAIRVAPGPAGRAAVRTIDQKLSAYTTVLIVPTNLVNFGQAVNFPLLLGLTLAVFGAATLAHLLLASASRRRREFALLKVLGFVRRQVRTTVAWQATTVALIGIVVGVPVGVAIGNLVWRAFASNLGVVPVTNVSVPAIVAIGVGVLVVGVVLASVPAAIAARARPAAVLREE